MFRSTLATRRGGPHRRIRSIALVVIVLVALSVATFFVSQTERHVSGQYAATERILHDFLALTASGIARQWREDVETGLEPTFRPVLASDVTPGGRLPSLATLRLASSPALSPRYYFRLDMRDSSSEVAEGSDRLSPGQRQSLAESLSHSFRSLPVAPGIALTTLRPTSALDLIAFVRIRDRRGTVVATYGFGISPGTFMAAIPPRRPVDQPSYTPTLVAGTPGDSLYSFRIEDAGGHTLFATPVQYHSDLEALAMEPGGLSGLTTVADMWPSIDDHLDRGSTIRHPVIWLWTVLLLTIGIVGLTLYQLWREDHLDRLRTEFVSSVSHELRTPLAQIRAFAEMLQLGWVRDPAAHARAVRVIDQEARRLTNLVENVLSFSKSANDIAYRPPALALAPAIRELVDNFAPLAEARGIHIRLALDEAVVAMVDRDALQQILTNLLDNAVKYGPWGQSVDIELTLTDAMARIQVDDQGPGIGGPEATRVWEPFYRLKRDRKSAIAGSGIGLAVVKQLVERHEGVVTLARSPSGGARFIVELPRATRADPPADAGPAVRPTLKVV